MNCFPWCSIFHGIRSQLLVTRGPKFPYLQQGGFLVFVVEEIPKITHIKHSSLLPADYYRVLIVVVVVSLIITKTTVHVLGNHQSSNRQDRSHCANQLWYCFHTLQYPMSQTVIILHGRHSLAAPRYEHLKVAVIMDVIYDTPLYYHHTIDIIIVWLLDSNNITVTVSIVVYY